MESSGEEREGKGRQKGKALGIKQGKGTDSHDKETAPTHGPSHGANHVPRKRVPVENSRKIWGTLKSTSTSMVLNAIQKTPPSSIGRNLTIKRKFKKDTSGATKIWWFVVRGSSCDIDFLKKNGQVSLCKLAGN